MNAELLAVNIAAHWVQAGVLATSALIAIRLLNLNEPRSRLAALHIAVVAIVVLPLVQPWSVAEPAVLATTPAAAVDVGTVVSAMPLGGEQDAAPWLNPAQGAVTIVAAGILMRLLWLFYGVIRLAR